ncbi:MAG: hypothetical protein CMJ32_04895 [Phycisphaerae bacterium]|nr:hypothetical protein [Phycisphaerae bacterium]
MLLFRKALHPEFFGIEGRTRLHLDDYEFEGWIFKGGHVARFQHNGVCISEVVHEQPEILPERGLVITMPCAGEKDHEERISEQMFYMTTMQTETLSDHLYMSTYNEMLEHAQDTSAISVQWNDDVERPNLSILDLQRYREEVHIQGYHLRSDCNLILRTQSLFKIAEQDEGQDAD